MRKTLLLISAVFTSLLGMSQTTMDTAINFVGETPYGETIELFNYLDDGKLVVIDFFNSM